MNPWEWFCRGTKHVSKEYDFIKGKCCTFMDITL